MYERFTDRALKVMRLANDNALEFYGATHILTDHVLFGLLEVNGVARNVMRSLGVDFLDLRRRLAEVNTERGIPANGIGKLPLSPVVERVIIYARDLVAGGALCAA